MAHGHTHTVPHEEAHADAWHHHTASEHPQFEHGSTIKYSSIIFWSVALVVVTVLSIGAVWIYFDAYTTKVKSDRLEYNLYQLHHTEADAFKLLQARPSRQYQSGVNTAFRTSGWIDTDKQIIQIPLETAKQKVMKQYGQTGSRTGTQNGSQPK